MDGDSTVSGDSAQDTQEMYEALDSLNMLPLSDATPISVVFPTTVGATAEILVQMNRGTSEGENAAINEVSKHLTVENPASATVLSPQVTI